MKEPLGKTIKSLDMNIRRFLDFHLDEHELGNGQFVLLIEVCENTGISQDTLSKKISLDKTTVAKSVKKMVANGYIVRKYDEKDRRSKKLYPTKKAEDIFPKIKKLSEIEREVLTAGLSKMEVETFLRIVECMKANISEYLESGGNSQWKK